MESISWLHEAAWCEPHRRKGERRRSRFSLSEFETFYRKTAGRPDPAIKTCVQAKDYGAIDQCGAQRGEIRNAEISAEHRPIGGANEPNSGTAPNQE